MILFDSCITPHDCVCDFVFVFKYKTVHVFYDFLHGFTCVLDVCARLRRINHVCELICLFTISYEMCVWPVYDVVRCVYDVTSVLYDCALFGLMLHYVCAMLCAFGV